jgi:hypothetical protein
MGQELAQVLCPECGASGESDPTETRWQCGNCGNGFFLRRCSACARVSYVDGLQGFHMPWSCTWCGLFNNGFSQNQDPATASAAELAAELTRYGQAGNPAGPGADGQDRAQAREMTAATRRSGARLPPFGLVSAISRPARHVRRILLFSGQVPGRPRSGRRAVRRITVPAVAVMACAAAVFALVTAGSPHMAGMATAGVAQGNGTRMVQVAVGRVSAVSLQSVPGQLAVIGTGPGRVTLTGQVRGTHGAPVVVSRVDHAANVLVVSIQCPPASQCTQNLRLAVPEETGTVLRQSGGRIVAAGLAGPLRITAAHVDISADGLRSPSLTAAITAGHLSAAFTVPPRQVSVTLTSAQASVRLPGRVAYQVNREVMSGYVRVTIPQETSVTRTVTARLQSSELELLPS